MFEIPSLFKPYRPNACTGTELSLSLKVNAENNELFEHQIDFASVRCTCVFFLLIHTVCSEEIRWASMPVQASWDGKKASVNFGQGQKFINKHELNWKRQSHGLKAIESIHVCCESGLGGVCRFSHVSKTWPYISSFLARSSKWVNIKIPLYQ